MFPFASQTVRSISHKGLVDRATELISIIQNAPNDETLIRRLKEQKAGTFFRITVINNERQVLYDSHVKGVLGLRFGKDYVVEHPEVIQAMQDGSGHHVGYSYVLGQKLTYTAQRFDFHGKPYILRVAFPYKYILEITRNFEIGFLGLATAVLLLFSLMTWLIINHLSEPIQEIIRAIKPYQEGTQKTIPKITLKMSNTDEFGQLASTLNSLSAIVKKQIDHLTFEKNEKISILESLIEGVMAVDDQMIVTYANGMALKLLDKKEAEVIGKSIAESVGTAASVFLKECQQHHTALSNTLELKTISGKIYLDVIAVPKQTEQGAVFVMQDKTAHHKMHEMRRDFVANVSHDLQTPLTIIYGFAEMLHDNPDLPTEVRQEITQKMSTNCKRMETLVKDLLALSDIEQLPASRLILCDLKKICEESCLLMQDAFPAAEIKFISPPESFYITGDPSLIEMAIKNLVENGAKYSHAPAFVEIALQREDPWIKVSVSDQGIGIPPEEIDKIFQRFYRVDKARSRKVGGSGLGLSIVETIAEKHNGKVTVHSTLGKGSTFTLWLPDNSSSQSEQVDAEWTVDSSSGPVD